MQNLFSGPRSDLKSGNPFKKQPLKFQDVILTSKKPVVVLLTEVLTEGIETFDGSGLRPIEENRKGIYVQQCESPLQHEFKTVNEAREFVRANQNPDRNPVEAIILEFRNQKWELIERS